MSPVIIALIRRLLPYFAGVAVFLGVVYGIHHHGTVGGRAEIQAKWDKAELDRKEAQAKKNAEDAAKLRKLEGDKNANLAEIDRLRANNHALWLRLPKTACGESGAPGGNIATGDGELPDSPQAALDRFMAGLADEAYRADKIIEDCRVLNEWIKGDGLAH
jgi:hypothetical protein